MKHLSKKLLAVTLGMGALLVGIQSANAGSSHDSRMHQTLAGQKGIYAPLAADTPATNAAGPFTSLCFTCGGAYPRFAGSFLTGGNGSNTVERGSACSGSLTTRTDSIPFLCSK
ncbi:MAG: hypothetical protein ACT4QA_06395 [Panacagrimonas sp.]